MEGSNLLFFRDIVAIIENLKTDANELRMDRFHDIRVLLRQANVILDFPGQTVGRIFFNHECARIGSVLFAFISISMMTSWLVPRLVS